MKNTGSIYVRLSRQAGEANLSRDGMVAECRALAEREGIYVVATHVDDGLSGAIRDRPEFTAWLNDAREGRAQVLIASHGDRLTREGVNAAALVLDVVEHKNAKTGAVEGPPVRLITVDGLDSEKDAEAFRWRFVIAAEVARAERERIRARNIANKARMRAEGRYQGGGAPWGTRVVARDGRTYLARDEDKAVHLEHVARMLLADQPVMAAIRWLNRNGHLTRRGKEWRSRSLRTTLLSEASRDVVFKDDPATWLALKRRLSPGTDGRKAIGAGRPPIWLLSRGNGICGKCGAKMVVGKTRGQTRYICNGRTSGMCGGNTISADAVDAYVEAEYLRLHGDLPIVETITHWPGQEELSRSVQVRDEALKAVQRGIPTRTAFDAYEAAQRAVEQWEDVVRSSEPSMSMVVADGSQGDRWKATAPNESDSDEERARKRTDRWRIIQSALARPIRVSPGRRGGVIVTGAIDTDRLDIAWQAETEPSVNE